MSKKEFPRHETTLVCDDIREERFNKISLIGLFGDEILVDPDDPNKILPKLCFFTRILGGEGVFKPSCSLKDPDGNELLSAVVFSDLATDPNMVANLTFVLSPFKAEKEGEYKYSIFLDDKKINTFKFKVTYKKLMSA